MVIIKHRPTVFTLLGHYQQNMYSLVWPVPHRSPEPWNSSAHKIIKVSPSNKTNDHISPIDVAGHN